MARMRARLGEPSDGLPPVIGTAAGCTGEADAATLALAEAEAEAEAVVVGVAVALAVGEADAEGVGVSVGIPASAVGAPEAKPISMKAPTIRTTSPATSILIVFLLSITQTFSVSHSPKRAYPDFVPRDVYQNHCKTRIARTSFDLLRPPPLVGMGSVSRR